MHNQKQLVSIKNICYSIKRKAIYATTLLILTKTDLNDDVGNVDCDINTYN